MRPDIRELEGVLRDVGAGAGRWRGHRLTAFVGCQGASATGELMIVGRALNRWRFDFLADELSETDGVARVLGLAAPRDHDEDPMAWVARRWGAPSGGYNTRRSAFWRVARRTTLDLGLAHDDPARWPSRLVGSNLYKVAPARGGNPGAGLRRVQLDGCARVLRAEVEHFRPRRVLLLTGLAWARPFLRRLAWEHRATPGPVQAVGVTSTGAPVVVAPHPQGRRERALAAAIVAAFHAADPEGEVPPRATAAP